MARSTGSLAGSSKGSSKGSRNGAGDELLAFPRPSLAVDVAVLTVAPTSQAASRIGSADVGSGGRRSDTEANGGGAAGSLVLCVLLLRRAELPAAGRWGLPGSFVRERKRLHAAVLRTLDVKCGISGLAPRQLRVFDDPGRDDRGWVVSVAHVDVVPIGAIPSAVSTSAELCLAVVDTRLGSPGPSAVGSRPTPSVQLPGKQRFLPFDHDEIVALAATDLRDRYRARPDPAGLVGDSFTLLELRRVHEAVLGEDLQKDTSRRQVLPYLEDTGELSDGPVGRPARLFRHSSPSNEVGG